MTTTEQSLGDGPMDKPVYRPPVLRTISASSSEGGPVGGMADGDPTGGGIFTYKGGS